MNTVYRLRIRKFRKQTPRGFRKVNYGGSIFVTIKFQLHLNIRRETLIKELYNSKMNQV